MSAAAGGKIFVQDLNENPSLSFISESGSYDVVLCALGVQYLEEPEMVFAEVDQKLDIIKSVRILGNRADSSLFLSYP